MMSQLSVVCLLTFLSVGLSQEILYSCKWKCLLFVQMWPGSFCPSLDSSVQCHIPQFVSGWTIHGLWPDGVTYCCNCWSLHPSQLEDLQQRLTHFWPSFLNKTDFLFWQNEWNKHGTCATCEEALSSPERYFEASLKLYQSINIQNALKKVNIIPTCNHTYRAQDILQGLQAELGNDIKVQCGTDSQGRQLLMQVHFGYNRNLTAGCYSNSRVSYPTCDTSQKVFFPPINYTNPQNPCP
ncbi:ribonuclease Oy-like [Discoglossus pictus]